MQLIQRTSCPDRQRSPSGYLATMIDRKTRDYSLSHVRSDGPPDRVQNGSSALDANVLIWVEGGGEPVREPADRGPRGILIAAHGLGQGSMDGCFTISYPLGEDDAGPHVPAVCGLLETLGWSVVASRHARTVEGSVNLALLLSTAPVGQERRLWLTESVGGTREQDESSSALAPGLPAVSAEGDAITAGIRNQLEAWVNEGGAGDDVAS
jgi:hypothetical protein